MPLQNLPGQPTFLAQCAALRAERQKFLRQNQANVAKIVEQARDARSRARRAADRSHAELRRSLTQSRLATQREVARTLDQFRSKRSWQGQQLQLELTANVRETRREVRRILRSAASQRARQQQQRLRTTAHALQAIRQSVREIRQAVGVTVC